MLTRHPLAALAAALWLAGCASAGGARRADPQPAPAPAAAAPPAVPAPAAAPEAAEPDASAPEPQAEAPRQSLVLWKGKEPAAGLAWQRTWTVLLQKTQDPYFSSAAREYAANDPSEAAPLVTRQVMATDGTWELVVGDCEPDAAAQALELVRDLNPQAFLRRSDAAEDAALDCPVSPYRTVRRAQLVRPLGGGWRFVTAVYQQYLGEEGAENGADLAVLSLVLGPRGELGDLFHTFDAEAELWRGDESGRCSVRALQEPDGPGPRVIAWIDCEAPPDCPLGAAGTTYLLDLAPRRDGAAWRLTSRVTSEEGALCGGEAAHDGERMDDTDPQDPEH